MQGDSSRQNSGGRDRETLEKSRLLNDGLGMDDKTGFDPAGLVDVETLEQIRAVPVGSEGLFVRRLDDQKLAAIAAHSPHLLHLIADGNTSVTDAGLTALGALIRLEHLDLEWSDVTDAGLPLIAALRSLRWVDLGFCARISAKGLEELRQLRPDLEIVKAELRPQG